MGDSLNRANKKPKEVLLVRRITRVGGRNIGPGEKPTLRGSGEAESSSVSPVNVTSGCPSLTVDGAVSAGRASPFCSLETGLPAQQTQQTEEAAVPQCELTFLRDTGRARRRSARG